MIIDSYHRRDPYARNVAKHEDSRPTPLAFELLAFASQVLRCDQLGCDRVASWRSAPPAEPAWRCDEHRSPTTTVPGIGPAPEHPGRHEQGTR